MGSARCSPSAPAPEWDSAGGAPSYVVTHVSVSGWLRGAAWDLPKS